MVAVDTGWQAGEGCLVCYCWCPLAILPVRLQDVLDHTQLLTWQVYDSRAKKVGSGRQEAAKLAARSARVKQY